LFEFINRLNNLQCQAERKGKGIKCLHTNVKKDLERTGIRKKGKVKISSFLNGLRLKVKGAIYCAFNL
jgi:hypothetical protein